MIDTGIGIREEVLPQLFQPFSQGEASISQKFGGTGLGLAISRHIAEMLGGELTATSVWGQGSTFTLTVPTGSLEGIAMLRQPAEAEQETAEHGDESLGRGPQGVRILLAEDGYDNQRLIETVLRKAGAEVEVVENGRLAVAKAESEPFDVILMDMNMPEMDGYEATRLLRDRGYAQADPGADGQRHVGRQRPLPGGRLQRSTCPSRSTGAVDPDDRRVRRQAGGHNGAIAAGRGVGRTPALSRLTWRQCAMRRGPIVSQFADDPEIAEILGGFVGRLAGQIDAMRQALADGRHEDLQRLGPQTQRRRRQLRLSPPDRGVPNAGRCRQGWRQSRRRPRLWTRWPPLAEAIQQGYSELAFTREDPIDENSDHRRRSRRLGGRQEPFGQGVRRDRLRGRGALPAWNWPAARNPT